MITVKQILDRKGYEIWTIEPQESVYTAIEHMAEKGIGALVVLQDGALVGIVSERDYARKVILKGRASQETAVHEIMTTEVVCTHLDESIEACMDLMTERRFRHLPVLDGHKVVGILSIGDLVKTIIAEQRFMIEQLESYITG